MLFADVDECQQAGGLYGHHCHSNTRCVNVLGSYVCQCLDGYARRDKFNCAEVGMLLGSLDSLISFQVNPPNQLVFEIKLLGNKPFCMFCKSLRYFKILVSLI